MIIWLERFTYEPLTVDNANAKLIEPVRGLIIDGRQLYRYKNELDIPIKRKVAISGAHKYFGATINVKQVVDFLEQIREANNHNDKSRVGLLAYSLEDMLKHCTDEEGLFRMAATMYFYRDEDHSQFDNDIMLEKVKAFRGLYGEKRDFFFSTLLRHMGVSSDTSISSILGNLKESRVKLMAYQDLLKDSPFVSSSGES